MQATKEPQPGRKPSIETMLKGCSALVRGYLEKDATGLGLAIYGLCKAVATEYGARHESTSGYKCTVPVGDGLQLVFFGTPAPNKKVTLDLLLNEERIGQLIIGPFGSCSSSQGNRDAMLLALALLDRGPEAAKNVLQIGDLVGVNMRDKQNKLASLRKEVAEITHDLAVARRLLKEMPTVSDLLEGARISRDWVE